MGQCSEPTDRGKRLGLVLWEVVVAAYFVALAVWAIMTGK
jgi:hypothetical protein